MKKPLKREKGGVISTRVCSHSPLPSLSFAPFSSIPSLYAFFQCLLCARAPGARLTQLIQALQIYSSFFFFLTYFFSTMNLFQIKGQNFHFTPVRPKRTQDISPTHFPNIFVFLFLYITSD
jgi:hypothetical protein